MGKVLIPASITVKSNTVLAPSSNPHFKSEYSTSQDFKVIKNKKTSFGSDPVTTLLAKGVPRFF